MVLTMSPAATATERQGGSAPAVAEVLTCAEEASLLGATEGWGGVAGLVLHPTAVRVTARMVPTSNLRNGLPLQDEWPGTRGSGLAPLEDTPCTSVNRARLRRGTSSSCLA